MAARQPDAKAPWDTEGFKLPSNKVHSPAGMNIWPPASAIYRRETQDNYPAARAMLSAVYEGLQLRWTRAACREPLLRQGAALARRRQR